LTSVCDELNASVSFWSVVSFARVIECQKVICTGLLAWFSAVNGQVLLVAATAPGTAVTAVRPVANTTTASPEPAQRFHDRMSAPPSITPMRVTAWPMVRQAWCQPPMRAL
jgi:hypothetical protein